MASFPSVRAHGARLRPAAWLVLLLGLAPGCGGGSGGSAFAPAPGVSLRIVPATPPILQADAPFSFTYDVEGGVPPYGWSIEPGSGQLPPGLRLDITGRVSGTPTSEGAFAFTLAVRDSSLTVRMATRRAVLEVGGFDVEVASLVAGEAWTGSGHELYAPAGGQAVTFQLVGSTVGGAIVDAEPSARRATYVAGSVPGVETVRCTRADGTYTFLRIPVVGHPAAGFVARFSTTDVWYVSFERKEAATHPFATDFDWSLSALGLRAPSSTDARGTDADLLAHLYVRLEVLRRLNGHFLLAADGSRRPESLDISFPFDPPGSPHLAPSPGTQTPAVPGGYNVISVQAGVEDAPDLGLSFSDDALNPHLENVSTTPGSHKRGAFVDGLIAGLGSAYFSADLLANPVGASDVPALRSLVYGTPSPGGRTETLRRVADAWANMLACVLAHEIGHALGLTHSEGLMRYDPGWLESPGFVTSFGFLDVLRLQDALPGPMR